MNHYFRLLLGLIMAVTVALRQFPVALANGNHGHVGSTGIPAIVVWIGGGCWGIAALYLHCATFFQTDREALPGRGAREESPER